MPQGVGDLIGAAINCLYGIFNPAYPLPLPAGSAAAYGLRMG